jgi:hypothetical protein
MGGTLRWRVSKGIRTITKSMSAVNDGEAVPLGEIPNLEIESAAAQANLSDAN